MGDESSDLDVWKFLMHRTDVHVLDVTDIDEQALQEHIRRQVVTELKRTTYHWTPLK